MKPLREWSWKGKLSLVFLLLTAYFLIYMSQILIQEMVDQLTKTVVPIECLEAMA